MQKQSIRSNLILQGLYQVLILGAPLIVSPYLTRTLGAEALGIYTFSNSIAYYFVIFAMLGISRHGQREIASNSYDEISLRTTFWSLYFLHAIISITALFAYIIYILFFVRTNNLVFWAQGLYVLSALVDITWFFYGIEQFKSVVIKNTIIKILELLLIFTFVKLSSDLLIYTIIMTCSILLGQVVMLPQAIKLVPPIHFSRTDAIKHIKPLFVLGISVVAVTLYTVFDKTLLGIMLNMSSVSFYEYANKIVSVPKSILGVISTVLFPRVCKMVDSNDNTGLKKFFNESLFLTSLFGFCFMFVLSGVSRTFAPLYFGEEFDICGKIIIAMSPVIIIVAIGDLVRTQLMISKHKDSQFIMCLIANAAVNIIISVILIKPLGVYGAVIGSVSAELFGLLLESYCCKEDIVIRDLIITAAPFIISGIIAFVCMDFIYRILGNSVMSLFVETLCGLIVYGVITLVYLVVSKNEMAKRILKHR